MNRRERQAAIGQAYADCGAAEYAARMQAMFVTESAGKLFERRIRPIREDYEREVGRIEFIRRQVEMDARLKLRARLIELGVIREV